MSKRRGRKPLGNVLEEVCQFWDHEIKGNTQNNREVSQEGFPSQKTFANLFAAGPGRKTFAKKPSFTTKGRNSSPPPPPPLSLLFPGHLLQNSLKALSAFLLPPKISGPCSYLRLVWWPPKWSFLLKLPSISPLSQMTFCTLPWPTLRSPDLLHPPSG